MPGQSTRSHGCGFAGGHQLHDGQIAHHSHALVARRANPSHASALAASGKSEAFSRASRLDEEGRTRDRHDT